MRRTLLIMVALFGFGGMTQAQAPAWKAGVAKVAITPEKAMWMSGYAGRKGPAEGKVHDLWAKALILEADGKKLALVTLDLVGISRDMSWTIKNRVQQKHGFPQENVILSVSHTHCGPVVKGNLEAMFALDKEQQDLVHEYSKQLVANVEKVIDDAAKNLAPANLSWAIGQAGFAVNRRNNKETDVVELREKGLLKGPIDHDVPVLAVRDADGKLKTIVCGYACHATTLSFDKWCGDYPGFATLELEKNHPGATALFWAGCGADQNPLPRRTVALAEQYGQELAKAVNDVLKKDMASLLTPTLAVSFTETSLVYDAMPSREQLVKDTESTNKYVAIRAKHLLATLEKEGSLKSSYLYPVQVIRLGKDLVWVTLGGEVVVDYSLRLKKELGPGKTWVMGYANDVMAYIPSLRVLKEGGYEGKESMIYYGLPTVWGPRVEETIVRTVHEQVKKVRGEK